MLRGVVNTAACLIIIVGAMWVAVTSACLATKAVNTMLADPKSMAKVDSFLVVYYGDRPITTDCIKMPRDSVQIVIDGVLGVPNKRLVMTIKMVDK